MSHASDLASADGSLAAATRDLLWTTAPPADTRRGCLVRRPWLLLLLLVGAVLATVLWRPWENTPAVVPMVPLQPSTPTAPASPATGELAPPSTPAGPNATSTVEDARQPATPPPSDDVRPTVVDVLLRVGDDRTPLVPVPFVDIQLLVGVTAPITARTDGQGRARLRRVGGHGLAATVRSALGGQSAVQLSGERVVEVELRLQPRLVVTGRVVDADARGIADAELLLLPWEAGNGDAPVPLGAGRSAADGSFRVPLLQGGRFGARHDAYAPSPMFLCRPAAAGAPPATLVLQLQLRSEFASVDGLVLDGTSGWPAPGCEVEFQSLQPTPLGADLPSAPVRVTSGEFGKFEVPRLPAGPTQYAARARDGGRLRGTLDLRAGQRHSLQLSLRPPSLLRGSVVDENGAPLAGARVAVDAAASIAGATTTTDADGRYQLDQVGPGLVQVEARWQPAGGVPRTAKQQLELQPGQAAEWHAVLGANTGNQLQGVLVDKNGQPLAGWSVLAHQRGQPSPITVSGSDGVFRLALPKQRSVDLRAFAPGRRPRSFADAVLREVDSGATGVRFVAERGAFGSARGRVQLANGTGVPAEIRCWHQERSEYVALQAQDDGMLQLRELPAGTMNFELHHPGAVRAVRSGVRIEAGGEVDLGLVELQPGASLRGAVRAADGSAIAGARLQIVAKDADFVADYDGGTYTFAALPPGNHRLQVQAPGHAATTFDVTMTAGQNQQRDVVLAAGVRKRVLLQVPAGALGNVTLAFQPAGGTLTWQHTTSLPQRTTAPQTLEFVAWLAPGSYQAIAWCGSDLAAEQGVLFAAGDEQPLELSLRKR